MFPRPVLWLSYLNFLPIESVQVMKGKEELGGQRLRTWEGLSLLNNQHCF